MGEFKRLYVVGILVLGLALTAALGRSSLSQTAGAPRLEYGRFQLVPYHWGNTDQLVLVDTRTGRMWEKKSVYVPATKKYMERWVEEGPFLGKATPR